MTGGAATTRGVTLVALMAALARPDWWLLALAGFLIRGGILPFLLAIVTLPSPLALSNIVAPDLQAIYLGQVNPDTAVRIGAAIGLAVAWLIGGTWLAAATEVVLVRDARSVALDEGLPAAAAVDPGPLLITRSAMAHLVALVPCAVAIGLGSIPIVLTARNELVVPSGSGPVVSRVLSQTVIPVAAIVAAWVLGEIVAGGAVRRIVLLGDSVLGAVGAAAADLIRRPLGSLATPLLTLVVLVLDLAAVLLVVAIVWSDVRDRLADPLSDLVALSLTLVTFAGAWCLALAVTGLVGAWRSVAMTFETDRVAAIDSARGSAVSTSTLAA